ncbi:hypothetical protein DVH24_042143 [Malus domestica]|uniref:Uncharacterized protein n=1 Tax=Malus domestica TaxID=3750 RepID=A0A498J264_MALDO|nr:hypothetical protein DVH24_042143 [Malus domestica]
MISYEVLLLSDGIGDFKRMSLLISSHRSVTSAPPLPPPPATTNATAPPQLDPTPLPQVDLFDPQVAQVLASSTSSVALSLSARRTYRQPRTCQHDIGFHIQGRWLATSVRFQIAQG